MARRWPGLGVFWREGPRARGQPGLAQPWEPGTAFQGKQPLLSTLVSESKDVFPPAAKKIFKAKKTKLLWERGRERPSQSLLTFLTPSWCLSSSPCPVLASSALRVSNPAWLCPAHLAASCRQEMPASPSSVG